MGDKSVWDQETEVHQGETGRKMAESEYKAMAMLFPVMPMMMPRPTAWGAYKDTPDTWFYLCQYFELSGDAPGFYELATCLGELHRQSARAGDFGLDLVTYGGKNTKYFPALPHLGGDLLQGLAVDLRHRRREPGPG
ncbi:hypothetical protein PG985_011953 [Apiospora marii]|uniref:uncharacterized protein n=1 Tax=Apiospora marii TaxID=335849 RepID=UPI0031314242